MHSKTSRTFLLASFFALGATGLASAQPGPGPQGPTPMHIQLAAELNGRVDQLTTEAPRGLDALEPWRIGVEARTLDTRERNLQVRERQIASMRQEAALVARQNPGAALQMLNAVREAESKLQEERETIGLNRANLNGRMNISNFMAGNYAGLADDIYRASNGQLRLQPRADGTFNIWGPEGERAPRATGVPAQEIIRRGRELYDDNFKTQAEAILKRQGEHQMHHGQRGDGMMGFAVGEAFARADANNDGKVSREEANAWLAARFAEIDANKDGGLTLEETRAFYTARRGEGRGPPEGMRERMESHHSARFRFIDADLDGKITLPELRVMADAMFRSMDADSDGALTRAELQRRGRRADGPRAQPLAPTPAQPAPR